MVKERSGNNVAGGDQGKGLSMSQVQQKFIHLLMYQV